MKPVAYCLVVGLGCAAVIGSVLALFVGKETASWALLLWPPIAVAMYWSVRRDQRT